MIKLDGARGLGFGQGNDLLKRYGYSYGKYGQDGVDSRSTGCG